MRTQPQAHIRPPACTHTCTYSFMHTRVAHMQGLSFIHFSIDVPATACLTAEFTFLDRLVMYGISPLLLLALMAIPSLWAQCRHHPAVDELIDRCIQWSFWILYLVFPMISRVGFSALVCDDLEEDGQYLAVDYRINCNSSAWKDRIRVFGWTFVCVWPVGFPLLCLGMLYWYSVPFIAKRKVAGAEWRAYLEHMLSQFLDRGLSLSGMTPDMQVADLTDDNLRSMLRVAHAAPVIKDNASTLAQRKLDRQRRKRSSVHRHQSANSGHCTNRQMSRGITCLEQAQLAAEDSTDSERIGQTSLIGHTEGRHRQVDSAPLALEKMTHQCESTADSEISLEQVGKAAVDKFDAMTRQNLLLHIHKDLKEMKTAEVLVLPRLEWGGKYQPSDEQLAYRRMGFLLSQYEPEYWYFEICEMMRKILLISLLPSLVRDGATSFLWGSFLLSFAALILTFSIKPYQVCCM